MKRFLRSRVLFLLCMALGIGIVFSGVTQAQITVSDPVMDGTTGGNFVGTYGECFFLLANPNFDRCEEEVGPASYANIPAAYRSPSDRNGCFDNNNPDDPVSDHGGPTNVCFGNPTAPLNTLPVEFDGFSVDDFSVYRVDNAPDQAVLSFMEPDIAFAWSTIAGPNGGQYASIPCTKNLPLDTDRFTTFDSEFVEDTAVTETVINQTGSITLAYYFVNAADVCRVLMYELYIDGTLEKSGTIGDFQSGKYLVFEEIAGLTGPTTIRLETTLISDPNQTPTSCGVAAPIPGVNAHISGVFISDCEPEPPCSIGDYVWEDADRDGCQDPVDERPIEGVEVKLFENCANPTEIASTTTNADGFYEFIGLDCGKEYRVQFGDAGDIYAYTEADSCTDGDLNIPADEQDSDCSQNDGFSGCVTFPDPVNEPDNPTIDCGYVCEGKIGDRVWLDDNEDGCQDEINTGIAGVDVTLSEDCVDRENPKTVRTNAVGFYEFAGLCPGDYFVEFGNGRPNTNPGQVCDNDDPDVSDEKDSNCGDEALQCVELTKDNSEDPTIDCGKVGPCLELEKLVSGDGGVNFFDADNCSDADVPFTADDAEYKLIVTNCGKEAVDLDRIVDLDLGINLVLDPVVTIQPNDSVEFTNDAGQTEGLLQKEGACPNPDNQFDNTATVFGTGDGSNLPVEATDPACVQCQPECDIKVTKTCAILPPPPGPEVSTCSDLKDVTGLTMIWKGPDGVNIQTELGQVINGINNGDIVFLNTPKDQTGNDVDVTVSGMVSGMSQFHISCSDQDMNGIEDCGKAQGNGKSDDSNLINLWEFGGMTGEKGQFTCPAAQPDPNGFPTETEECEFTPQPEGGNCDDIKDVTALTLVWDGPSGLNIASEVGQVINNIQKGDVIVLNTPKDQTGNDVQVTLTGSVTSESEFHISCSDNDMDGPEDCGSAQGNGKGDDTSLNNQWLFGGMTGEKGSFGCPGVPGGPDSAEVVYGIRVENLENEPVEVRIFDAKLGIDQLETIAANDTFELVTDPTTVTPDDTNEFTNTVEVDGRTDSGAECKATDSVTVKRNPPPPSPVSCSDIKDITAVSLIWTGDGPIDVVTEGGQMFEDVETGNKITFNTPAKDTDLFISGAVNGTSTVHVSCSDEDMNGTEDCGKAAGNGKSNDSNRINLWLFDGMIGEKGSFDCGLPNTGVVTNPDSSDGYVTGAAMLDLGDDKKVKWELTNNGTQDVFVTRVEVTWPTQHEQVKKFKLEGDFAKDVFDDNAPTAVPDEKAFESDPNKRKLKKGDHKKLEIEFTEKYKNHSQSDFTIEVAFENGETLSFP